jgi:hypothetical protein
MGRLSTWVWGMAREVDGWTDLVGALVGACDGALDGEADGRRCQPERDHMRKGLSPKHTRWLFALRHSRSKCRPPARRKRYILCVVYCGSHADCGGSQCYRWHRRCKRRQPTRGQRWKSRLLCCRALQTRRLHPRWCIGRAGVGPCVCVEIRTGGANGTHRTGTLTGGAWDQEESPVAIAGAPTLVCAHSVCA